MRGLKQQDYILYNPKPFTFKKYVDFLETKKSLNYNTVVGVIKNFPTTPFWHDEGMWHRLC